MQINNYVGHQLIMKIICQSVKDLKLINYRNDALVFFRSGWGQDLCDYAGYDSLEIIRRVDKHKNKIFKIAGNN